VPTFLRWQEFVCTVFADKDFRPVVYEAAQPAAKLGKIFTSQAHEDQNHEVTPTTEGSTEMITRRQFSKVVGATVVSTSLPQASMAAPTVKALGVGDTGCKIVELLRTQVQLSDKCTALTVNRDTDCQAGDISITSGMWDPLTAKDAGLMQDLVVGTDVLILIAGMGGGAGTELTRQFGLFAKRAKAEVVAILVMPFDFEMPFRTTKAREGASRIAAIADRVHVLENQSLVERFRYSPMGVALRHMEKLAIQEFAWEAAHMGALA